MNKPKPKFDLEICMSCTACKYSCPFGCIDMVETKEKRDKPSLMQADKCTSCGICVKSCPVEAISLA